METLTRNSFNMWGTESWINLSLNQVIPIEKMYPVWENIGSTFVLVGWTKIIWTVTTADADEYGNNLWVSTRLTTPILVDPGLASNLALWEYYINYSTWEVKTKSALPGRVLFIYKIDNTVSINTTEVTYRFAYNVNNNMEFEGVAPVWSLETASAWMIKKHIYDVNNNLISVLYSNWSSTQNVPWTDRDILAYV